MVRNPLGVESATKCVGDGVKVTASERGDNIIFFCGTQNDEIGG